MDDRRDNETWLIDAAHAVIAKRVTAGDAALSPRERLIHRFWIADYAMRSAGDLAPARDLAPHYRDEARVAAELLGLPHASAAFALSEGELERRFFDLFAPLATELRAARIANSVP